MGSQLGTYFCGGMIRCNAGATQDKVQLPTSTVEFPGKTAVRRLVQDQSGTTLYYGLKVLEGVMPQLI